MLWHKAIGAGGLVGGGGGGGGEVTFVGAVVDDGTFASTIGADDCVILFQGKGGSSPSSVPDGFTLLASSVNDDFWAAAYYSFGAQSILLTANYGVAFAFTGTASALAPTVASIEGFGNTADPPSLTGFSEGDMVVAGACFDFESIDFGPIGFISTLNGRIGAAYNSSTTSTEDPPGFEISGNDPWIAFTIKVQAG